MKVFAKDAIASILRDEHVEHVFGYSGGYIMGMFNAMDKAGINVILNRTEGGAVYMADGYTRASGKVGVVLATGGPGATNLVTGLATAFADSIPIIAIAGCLPMTSFGKCVDQDSSGWGWSVEQRAIFNPVCKKAMFAATPQLVPDILRDAFRIAQSGRPGPVYVEVPWDVADAEIDYSPLRHGHYRDKRPAAVNGGQAREIIEALYGAKQPVVIIGEGALEEGIVHPMMKFLEETQIPFSATAQGKNAVDELHSLYLGPMTELGSKPVLHEYLKVADFILHLGYRKPVGGYGTQTGSETQIAQIDPDPYEIGRSHVVQYSAVGSIRSFLDHVPAKAHKEAARIAEKVAAIKERFARPSELPDENGIDPLNITFFVEKSAPDDAVIVCDTGYTKMRCILNFRTGIDQPFLVPDKYGTMGFSVPAALGAALGTKREVICFSGDGGFQMTINELGTAMNYGLKVIFILENNGGCLSIRDGNIKIYDHDCASVFENPDYAKIAEAYGMRGFTVHTSDEFRAAFRQALTEKTSCIINAMIDETKTAW